MKSLLVIGFIGIGSISVFNGQMAHGFTTGQDTTMYKVYKIDSINNYYLIYARRGNSLFKIVSEKIRVEQCRCISQGNEYTFQLHSMSHINGKPITPPASAMEVSGMYVDKTTIINFEGDSIRDLYYGDNIKGLCFTK
jgi:hypothetical protein